MKALLVAIASLSLSPAYAFENLIVDSTFQQPVVLTGNVQSSGWTNVSSSPSVPLSFGSIGGIAAAATTVVIAVSNPFIGAPAATVGSATNLPGNSGSQLVATTANVPPSNVSQLSLAAPIAVAASNSPNITPAAPVVAVAVPKPFVGASTIGSTINLSGNSGSQLVTTTFNVRPLTPKVPQPSLAAPTVVAPAAPAVVVAIPDPVPAGITTGAGGSGGAGNANGGGVGGKAGGGSGSTFNIADVFLDGNRGKGGGSAASMNGGATHGVPGPQAGAGLPILILLGCIAYGVMKRRMQRHSA